MLSNGRKTPNPVVFDYDESDNNRPVWKVILDIIIILGITTAFVLSAVYVLFVAIPGMW